MGKFIIKPREDTTVTVTLRSERNLIEQYDRLSAITNRSRNELLNAALTYALENMELQE